MKKPSNLHAAFAVTLLASASALGLTLGGCASAPVPNEQMAVAEAAVARASTTSTSESAPTELRVANEKLASARAALGAGERETARRLAEQATLDAQVAELHAQARRSRQAALESQDAARVLREETHRKAVR